MNYYIIPAALIVTFTLALLFSVFLNRPLRGLWLFVLVVFLASWAGQLWITPFGPLILGVAWVPLVIVAVFFAFLMFALLPPPVSQPTATVTEEESAAIAIGTLFWIILILLVLFIVIGYYRLTHFGVIEV
jgi:hypothetical protein